MSKKFLAAIRQITHCSNYSTSTVRYTALFNRLYKAVVTC